MAGRVRDTSIHRAVLSALGQPYNWKESVQDHGDTSR